MKKIAGILASIFMALALVGGSAFLLHEVERTSIVEEQDEDSLIKANVNGDWADTRCHQNYTKSGNNITISNVNQLAKFAYNVNNGLDDAASANVKLSTSLEDNWLNGLSIHYWTPIGNSNYSFTGTFDGGGNGIYGLTIAITANKTFSNKNIRNIGLFGNLKGTVKNLVVSGTVEITSGTCQTGPNYDQQHADADTYNFGGIAGKLEGGKIENCESRVDFKYIRQDIVANKYAYDLTDDVNIGGIVGFSDTTNTIEGCAYSGKILFNNAKRENARIFRRENNTFNFKFGGIAGKSQNTTFNECVFEGKISITKPHIMDTIYIGGIVAQYVYTLSNYDGMEMVGCISQGSISLSEDITNDLDGSGVQHSAAIGGIVGFVSKSGKAATVSILCCHNFSEITQNLTGYPKFHMGGIVGYFESLEAFIANCSNLGNITNNWDEFSQANDVESGAGTSGIIGTFDSSGNDLLIDHCVNYGDINSTKGGRVGGILGNERRGEILIYWCINYGTMSCTDYTGTKGGLFGYFKDSDPVVKNCVSYTHSGNLWGSDLGSKKIKQIKNCYYLSTESVDDTLSRFNDPSNWTTDIEGAKLYTYHLPFDFEEWNYFYITPKNEDSIIYRYYKQDKATTKNAIMPVSLTSLVRIRYLYQDGSDWKNFKYDDTNVGTSMRGQNSYVFANGDYDDVVTLKGVATDVDLFRCNYYEFYYDSMPQSANDSVYIHRGDIITATINSYKDDIVGVAIPLQPKKHTISVEEVGMTGGTITVNGSAVSGGKVTIDKYIYKHEANRTLTVRVTLSSQQHQTYGIKSISFSSDTTTKTGTNTDYSQNSFEGVYGNFNLCEIVKITITYIQLTKDINFSYRLGINGTKQRGTSCTYGGIDMTKTTVAVSPNSITFSHDKWIYLYTNPGYHISSISIVNNTETTYFNNLSDTWLNNYLNTNYRYMNVSSITINYARTTFNTNIYVDGTLKKENIGLDLFASKSMQTLTNSDGIKSGYKYGVYAGAATSSVARCFELGTSTETSPHQSSLKLAKDKNEDLYAQVTVVLSDFVGQRVYASRNTGADAYSSNSQNLYIDLIKEKAAVNFKIASTNKVKNGTSYIDAQNATTENGLDDNGYGYEMGGMTYFTINSEKKIDEYIQTNQDATFSAIAMPGYVFKGIVAVKGSQSQDDNPVQIDALSNAFDIFIKISNLSVGDNIDYSQLENTTIYAYYDIATYKIETYKQIDKNGKENVTYDSTNGYFDWTEGPSSDDRKILSYFDEITFAVKSERYSSDNLEFLGIYLLDGENEKLLTLDTNYNFVNYNPNFVFTNKVYSDLIDNEEVKTTGESPVEITNYARFDVFDVHEKYIDLKYKGTGYYIEQNPSSYLRLLVKFATKPTTSSAPTQSNNVIEISSVEDLVWLSNQVNSGNTFEDYTIKQTANIDFGDSYIDPIGTEDHPFKGTYDGQGYVIKNLKLTNGATAIGTNVGLFGYTKKATIKNLTLIGGSVTGFNNVGAVVGCAENTTIENVTNNGCQVNAIVYQYYDIYGDELIIHPNMDLGITDSIRTIGDSDKYICKFTFKENSIHVYETYDSEAAEGQKFTEEIEDHEVLNKIQEDIFKEDIIESKSTYYLVKIDDKNYYLNPEDISNFRLTITKISYKSDRAYGGLVGVVSNCTIEGCGVRADITDTKQVDVDVTIVRGLIGTAFYTNDDTTEIPIKECYYIGNLPLHDNDIFDSLVHYVPDSDDPEEQLEVELIENCFYDTNSTRYYIINSNKNGTEDQIEPNKFNSAIWFKIGNSYELKIFYWS